MNVSLLPIKMFIVHGLSDNPESMAPLAATLTATLAAPGRSDGEFVVEHRFAFDSVQGPPGSPSSCDPIEVAAQKLATYILFNSAPYQRIALIGHSLGGLVIRKMMTDRLLPVSMTDYFHRVVVGLATIGTPHLGYPYLSIDELIKCSSQVRAMDSYLMEGGSLNDSGVLRSDFLRTLRAGFDRADFGNQFFAAGGRGCSARLRTGDLFVFNGCRVESPFNDGVVCFDSAALFYPGSISPTAQYFDDEARFRHAESIGYWGANVLCSTNASTTNNIIDPPPESDLFIQLVRFLRGLSNVRPSGFLVHPIIQLWA